MKKRLLFFLLFIQAVAVAQPVSLEWPAINTNSKPGTWWWWLGNAVDTTGLSNNLQKLNEAGFGRVSVTPIYGTKGYEDQFIDFLSPEWMNMFSYTVSKSDDLGIDVSMTTGTGWPFGGPNIPIKYAASKAVFQQYTLKQGQKLEKPLVVKSSDQKGFAQLQVLMAYSGNGKKINLTDKVGKNGELRWKAPIGKWRLIAVFDGKTLQKVKRAAPGGEGYVMNFFSKEAIQTYLRRFTIAFESSEVPVPDVFYNDSYEVYDANWSPHFFEEFLQRRGYHLENYLPELLGDGNQDIVARVRADYRRTLSDMLLKNFTNTWVQWTHEMGSKSRSQAHGSPGNLLDLYAAADIPETETFGESNIHVGGSEVTTVDPFFIKFASSAAHISGKKYVSSETFTWMIEHFQSRLSVAKPILDEVLLSGINHLFFHGTPYSPKGVQWPGWQFYASVNFTPYNPMWHDIPAFNRYIARIQSFLQSGEPDNDVLLYWPIHDLWYKLKKPLMVQLSVHNLDRWLYETPFYQTAKKLRQDGYSVDYISDRYLQKTNVEDGKIKTPGAQYKTLVVPPSRFMPNATMQAILRLISSGGKVIFLDHLPEDVPGLSNLNQRRKEFEKNIRSFPKGSPFTKNQAYSYGKGKVLTGSKLEKLLPLTDIDRETMVDLGLKYTRRKLTDGTVYFILNPHTNNPIDSWIPLSLPASSAAIFDPYSDQKGVAGLKAPNGKTRVYLQLKPGQSTIVRTYNDKKIIGNPWSYYKPEDQSFAIKGPWHFSFNKGWPEISEDFTINDLHSWTTLTDSARIFAGTGDYEILFRLPKEDVDGWLLKLGKVKYGARVYLNGHKVGTLWAHPFEIRIGRYVRPGDNTLKIEVTNSGANRISSYDRKGKNWKKFYDINFVNKDYKPFDASGWPIDSSGLLGPVELIPLKKISDKN